MKNIQINYDSSSSSWKPLLYGLFVVTAGVTGEVIKEKRRTKEKAKRLHDEMEAEKEKQNMATKARQQKNKDELEHIANKYKLAEDHAKVMREINGMSFGQPIQENDDDSLSIPLTMHSTEDLFSRPRNHSTNWIVDGYAKPGQVTMLVAGSGIGKSILLTSIALAVAKGNRPEFLPETCCASVKQKVVFYRLEDFNGELVGKYGEGSIFKDTHIQWVLPEDLPNTTLASFIQHLKKMASYLKEDTVVFVDPATKLGGYNHKDFIKGLEAAQETAKANGITLTPVFAAHHDEIKEWKHLTPEDIKGGDIAIQQAGAVIAFRMERTAGNEYRFIQCLKEPKGQPKPFPEGVLVCKKVKEVLDENNSYIHFQYVEIKPEEKALPLKPKPQADDIKSASPNLPKKAPNQKLGAEEDLLLLEWQSQGKKPKEMVELLHERGIKVTDKAIRNHLNRLKNSAG